MSGWILAKALLFTILVPGTFSVLVPAWIVDATGGTHAHGAWRYAALLPAAAGVGIYLWCALDFARAGGTPAPIDPPRELVVRGLYRYSRNPMYVGVLTLVVSQALYFGSPWLLLYAAFLFTGFRRFAVLYEEPTLSRSFGAAYDRYRACVPRWLPGRRNQS